MPTPRRSRADMAQHTTEALLAAGRAAFAENGFAATPLEALAAAAKVTRGALHHHFTNKTGLFEAVLRRIVAEVAAEVATEMNAKLNAAGSAAPDDWISFQSGFHAYLDAILRPDRRRILFQDGLAVLGVKTFDILMESDFGTMVEALRRLITAGRIAATDPEALGHLMNGAAINLAFWAAEGAPSDNRLPRAHAALQTLFDGLTR